MYIVIGPILPNRRYNSGARPVGGIQTAGATDTDWLVPPPDPRSALVAINCFTYIEIWTVTLTASDMYRLEK